VARWVPGPLLTVVRDLGGGLLGEMGPTLNLNPCNTEGS
jgi:hypothetical protein